MHKAIIFTAIILFLATSLCLAEELTITTYYPSPFGVYNQLNTNTLGVGDNDGVSGLTSADAPDPESNPGDVWIAGDVGIGTGTMGPQDELDVEGIIRVSTLGSATSTPLCHNDSNQIAGCITPPVYTEDQPCTAGVLNDNRPGCTASCNPGDIVVGGGLRESGTTTGLVSKDSCPNSNNTGWYCRMIILWLGKGVEYTCYAQCLRQ